MKVDAKSALVGAALSCVVVLVVGAQSVKRIRPIPRGSIQIEGVPTPDQLFFMRLDQDFFQSPTSYTVPAGKVLVITGWRIFGTICGTVRGRLTIDGTSPLPLSGNEEGRFSPGFPAASESVISFEIDNPQSCSPASFDAFIEGYLADAR